MWSIFSNREFHTKTVKFQWICFGFYTFGLCCGAICHTQSMSQFQQKLFVFLRFSFVFHWKAPWIISFSSFFWATDKSVPDNKKNARTFEQFEKCSWMKWFWNEILEFRLLFFLWGHSKSTVYKLLIQKPTWFMHNAYLFNYFMKGTGAVKN